MEGLDTFAAFAATYGSLDDAEADYQAIKSLYYNEKIIDTFDAAIIAKDDKGKVKIVKKHEQPLRQGAWVGGGWGWRPACASPCSQPSPSAPASCGARASAPAWGRSLDTRPAG